MCVEEILKQWWAGKEAFKYYLRDSEGFTIMALIENNAWGTDRTLTEGIWVRVIESKLRFARRVFGEGNIIFMRISKLLYVGNDMSREQEAAQVYNPTPKSGGQQSGDMSDDPMRLPPSYQISRP